MTIFGPDISSYQQGLSLSALGAASFVIAKTTEGTYYTDAGYQGWRQQAARLGKPFAWYHFLSGEDARAQAAHTRANVGDTGLPGMLDFEPTPRFRPTLAQAIAYVDAAAAAGLRLRLVYLPRWYWQELGSPNLTALSARGLSLVSSSYPGGGGSPAGLYPGDGAGGWQPYGGMTPLIYQYTDRATDGGRPLDYNAFRGNTSQLLAALGTPTPGDDVTPQDIQAIAAAVYNYGREDVNLNGGVSHNVPLGNLAHGAWVSVNDPAGPVLAQLAGIAAQVKALAAPTIDPAALAAAIAPLLNASATPEAIAQAVISHIDITVGTK